MKTKGKGFCGIPNNDICGKYHAHAQPESEQKEPALVVCIERLTADRDRLREVNKELLEALKNLVQFYELDTIRAARAAIKRAEEIK